MRLCWWVLFQDWPLFKLLKSTTRLSVLRPGWVKVHKLFIRLLFAIKPMFFMFIKNRRVLKMQSRGFKVFIMQQQEFYFELKNIKMRLYLDMVPERQLMLIMLKQIYRLQHLQAQLMRWMQSWSFFLQQSNTELRMWGKLLSECNWKKMRLMLIEYRWVSEL